MSKNSRVDPSEQGTVVDADMPDDTRFELGELKDMVIEAIEGSNVVVESGGVGMLDGLVRHCMAVIVWQNLSLTVWNCISVRHSRSTEGDQYSDATAIERRGRKYMLL
jgi:hypothetical protein